MPGIQSCRRSRLVLHFRPGPELRRHLGPVPGLLIPVQEPPMTLRKRRVARLGQCLGRRPFRVLHPRQVAGVEPDPRGELRQAPAVRQPFLAHLTAEMPGRANRFASHDSSLSQRRSTIRAQSLWSLYPRSGERIVRAGDASSRRHTAPGQTMQTSDEPADFTRLDDSALLSWRARARTELERLRPRSAAREALSALYDASLDELVERARKAWAKTS